MRVYLLTSLFGVLLCLTFAGTLAAAENPQDDRIFATLDKPANLEFIETPIADVTAYLADLYEIQILFDDRAMNEFGIGTDVPITYTSRGESLGTALEFILEQNDLTYAVQHGSLLITTKTAPHHYVTQTFSVADIVKPFDPLHRPSLVQPFGAGPSCIAGSPAGLPGSAEQLAEVIEAAIDPASWTNNQGHGSVWPLKDTLVVRQTVRNQRRIKRLLAAIKTLQKSDGDAARGISLDRYPRNAKIASALETLTNAEFIETPLHDVLGYLESVREVPIRLDSQALDNAGINTSRPVTMNLDLPLHALLDHMLLQLNVTWIALEDIILVTTLEAASQWQELHIYNVAGLATPNWNETQPDAYEDLQHIISSTVDPKSWENTSGTAVQAVFGNWLVVKQLPRNQGEIAALLDSLRTAQKKDAVDRIPPDRVERHVYPILIRSQKPDAQMQPLAELVTKSIEPQSWTTTGGTGTVLTFDNALIVTNTRRVHFEVRKLLSDLGLWSASHQIGIPAEPVVGATETSETPQVASTASK